MNDLSSDIGLLKRQFRDVHSVVSRLDHKLTEPAAIHPSPQHLVSKVLACHLLGRARTKPAAAIAAEVYGNDPDLLKALAAPGMVGKAASGPAMTTVAAFAGSSPCPAQPIPVSCKCSRRTRSTPSYRNILAPSACHRSAVAASRCRAVRRRRPCCSICRGRPADRREANGVVQRLAVSQEGGCDFDVLRRVGQAFSAFDRIRCPCHHVIRRCGFYRWRLARCQSSERHPSCRDLKLL